MVGTIDLKRVVARKNQSLSEHIPPFAYRILNRILHVREINTIMRRFGALEGRAFVDAVCQFLDLEIETVGDEYLAEVSAPVIAANHPLGGLDGLALMSIVGRRFGDFVVPANDFLMSVPNLRPLLAPVNKHGSNRRNFLYLIDVFTSKKTIVHFPAGLCSRRRGHLIRDLQWQKSFIAKSRDAERVIIPTYIAGRNSYRFYRLAQLRARSGWRFNIEMILLVDELFRQRGGRLRIVFGPPITATAFDRGRSDARWAELLRRYVYLLAAHPRLPFLRWVAALEGR